jgi:hypothetical protein
MRIDPPISEPVASGVVPDAKLAAEPPEEPPGVNFGFHGLRVTPHSLVCVTEEQENSGVAVRAWTTPPALRMRSLLGEVTSGTKSL